MRKTIKIVAALIAVATLCATPLFAAEYAEAVRV